jgi:hypothetical protein
VSKCQPFGIKCWLYARADQRQDRKHDNHGEPAIYYGRSTMDNRSSYVLYVPGRPRPTFVSTNNEIFGNKCPMAKDAPDFIGNDQVALDFRRRQMFQKSARRVDSSVEMILDQTETHYILQMSSDSIRSMAKPTFEALLVRAQNAKWSQKNANGSNHVPSGTPCICVRPRRCYNRKIYGNSKIC